MSEDNGTSQKKAQLQRRLELLQESLDTEKSDESKTETKKQINLLKNQILDISSSKENPMKHIIKASQSRIQETAAKVEKPQSLLKLEAMLKPLVFKGPYSDGREWDLVIKARNPLDKMNLIGDLAAKFLKEGWTKPSDMYRSTLCIKIDKNTVVAIDFTDEGLQITYVTQ